MIGRRLDGKYELAKLIGQGAMGAIYEAKNTVTGRAVAVKVISDEALTLNEEVLACAATDFTVNNHVSARVGFTRGSALRPAVLLSPFIERAPSMLRSHVLIAGLSLVALGASLYGLGCESDVNTPVDQTGRIPPPDPNGPAGDGPGYVFAVSKLFLGDTDRKGAPSPSAWKDYGYNLDALVSDKDSINLCRPAAGGSPATVYPDGNEGIDNSFGKNILPIITGLASDASQTLNESIADGSFTIMIRIDELGDKANYSGLKSALYGGGKLETVPKFDGTDEWPVVPELLEDKTDINSSKVTFDTSYVNEHTWVSGTPGTLDLSLSVQGYTITLIIEKAVITMDMGVPRSQGAVGGVIAGILGTDQLTSEIKKVAGSFDEGLCEGTTIESLLDQLRQASDIRADGSQDPALECNGISIGLGFESKLVQLGQIAPEAEVPEDPCNAMGGNGGEGGSNEGGAGGVGGAEEGGSGGTGGVGGAGGSGG